VLNLLGACVSFLVDLLASSEEKHWPLCIAYDPRIRTCCWDIVLEVDENEARHRRSDVDWFEGASSG